jgi:hypothetical protein
MATITPIKVIPHTRIENSVIANMADIGVYCYAVYSAIKMHLNQTTGACFPSYATIARITGIHRSTVIECVKTLTARKLISPHWRYKEDGGHASNQYNFGRLRALQKRLKNHLIQLRVVVQNDHP